MASRRSSQLSYSREVAEYNPAIVRRPTEPYRVRSRLGARRPVASQPETKRNRDDKRGRQTGQAPVERTAAARPGGGCTSQSISAPVTIASPRISPQASNPWLPVGVLAGRDPERDRKPRLAGPSGRSGRRWRVPRLTPVARGASPAGGPVANHGELLRAGRSESPQFPGVWGLGSGVWWSLGSGVRRSAAWPNRRRHAGPHHAAGCPSRRHRARLDDGRPARSSPRTGGWSRRSPRRPRPDRRARPTGHLGQGGVGGARADSAARASLSLPPRRSPPTSSKAGSAATEAQFDS
jgi:hypothetical protein